jgi:hypothetical protein
MKKSLIYIWLLFLVLSFFVWWYLYAWLIFAKPHFHANFMMYVNWKRLLFTDDKYSEDIWKCKIEENMSPRDRVHLHENNQDTIHVHHDWVAWWHFFSNINYYFSDEYLITDTWKVYKSDEKNKLTYILNGKKIVNPFNRMINSEDRLLINYWNESEELLLKERFNQVPKDAGEFNHKYDPWTCSWTNENSIFFLIKQLLHINH